MSSHCPQSVAPHCACIVLATVGAIFELLRIAACVIFEPLDIYDTGLCAAPPAALVAALCGHLVVTSTFIAVEPWSSPLSIVAAGLFVAAIVLSRGDVAMILGFLLGAGTVTLVWRPNRATRPGSST